MPMGPYILKPIFVMFAVSVPGLFVWHTGRGAVYEWAVGAVDLIFAALNLDYEYASFVGVSIEYFLLVFPFVAIGVLVTAMDGRHARPRELRCLTCGYRLKGLSKPQCPECGADI